MKKILVVVGVLITIVLLVESYLHLGGYSEEEACNCANVLHSMIYNVIHDEEIYENMNPDFTISTLEEFMDDSEISEEIKTRLDEFIVKKNSEDSSYKSAHIEKYQYYIEVKDKKIQLVLCSRFKYLSSVGSAQKSYQTNKRNFKDIAQKLFDDFEKSAI